MFPFKKHIFCALMAASLTACGTTKSNTARVETPNLLTPAQVSLLQDGAKPNTVYDAVDGSVIAEVGPDGKPHVYI